MLWLLLRKAAQSAPSRRVEALDRSGDLDDEVLIELLVVDLEHDGVGAAHGCGPSLRRAALPDGRVRELVDDLVCSGDGDGACGLTEVGGDEDPSAVDVVCWKEGAVTRDDDLVRLSPRQESSNASLEGVRGSACAIPGTTDATPTATARTPALRRRLIMTSPVPLGPLRSPSRPQRASVESARRVRGPSIVISGGHCRRCLGGSADPVHHERDQVLHEAPARRVGHLGEGLLEGHGSGSGDPSGELLREGDTPVACIIAKISPIISAERSSGGRATN